MLRVLNGEVEAIPPVWLMRQAGRYLPEYRELREKAGSFLDLCYNPELAAEVTLQPIRRFDFDAAILFADILLIPQALGQNLIFAPGDGPRLSPVLEKSDIEKFRNQNIHQTLAPVYETVRRVRASLSPEKALIGFAGAPWTVATYMMAGGPNKDPAALRRRWYDAREFIIELIDVLVDATADYLVAQIDAGADSVQIFDSWAGGMPEDVTRAVSLEPLGRLAERVKKLRPRTPVILFPKGAGALLGDYAAIKSCSAVGVDYSTPWRAARAMISPNAAAQGGLDPMLVVKGGPDMEMGARGLIDTFSGVPYIFNLGHGLTPDTPPENVARLVGAVRAG
ncbi:MAG: uroporphyrinogen decarboxylase [Parvularculaceae bacterium]|nr:uroporphyrinogen decarboxylase [Parvularculaceae bacterium]